MRNLSQFDLQNLINNLQFVDVRDLTLYGRIPKIGSVMERDILARLLNHPQLSEYADEHGTPIYYRTTGGRYFKVVTNYPTGSSKEKPLLLKSNMRDAIGCLLSSNLSFWFYQIYSNNLDWKGYEIEHFPVPSLNSEQIERLDTLYAEYLEDIERNARTRNSSGESTYNVDSFKEYKIVYSKPIIDKIDDYIAPIYGLTSQELDFTKNYELEFRMAGDD